MTARKKTMKKELNLLKKKVSDLLPETKETVYISDTITGDYTGNNTATTGFLAGSAVIMNPALSYIPEGASYDERVGREIMPISISMDVVLRAPSTGTLPIPWRLLVFQDRGYAGTAITLAQLLQQPSVGATQYGTLTAPYNPDFVAHKGDRKNRIKILIDKKGMINPRNAQEGYPAGGAIPITYNRSVYPSVVKIHATRSKGLSKINYQGPNNTDFVGGSIFYFLMLGYDITSGNPSGYVRSRIEYTDT